MKLYAAHSCSILCETYYNTNFSNCKIKWEKRFYFKRLCLWYHLSQQGTTCSKSSIRTLKHKNKVWKLFRIKNENNGAVVVSLLLTVKMFQTCCYCWLWTGKRLPGLYQKDEHVWRQVRIYPALCCRILKFINK